METKWSLRSVRTRRRDSERRERGDFDANLLLPFSQASMDNYRRLRPLMLRICNATLGEGAQRGTTNSLRRSR